MRVLCFPQPFVPVPRVLRFLPVALALTLAACDSGGGGSKTPSVASVGVSPATVTLAVNQSQTLTAVPRDASGKTASAAITWSSSNETVATVTTAGVVTGKTAGTATITAAAGGKSGVSSVTVTGGSTSTDVTFNVNSTSACLSPTSRAFRKVAEGTRAIFYEDTTNPSGGFSDADYRAISDAFDGIVWRVNTTNFGTPFDVDGNGKVNILYTRAVNELTASGSSSYVGGFFYARDLFPKSGGVLAGTNFGSTTCAGSNQAEMFYMLAPDPSGAVNGNARSVDFVKRVTVATLAHEFQHLINASRRLFDGQQGDRWGASSGEDSWLDEGLAHIAEELAFYDAAGLAPGQNIGIDALRASQATLGAFNGYQNSNLGRAITHLQSVNDDSPYDLTADLGTRGAAWWLLRFAADRRGGSQTAFWQALVNNTPVGFDNLRSAYGGDLPALVRDWNVHLFTDDLPSVAGAHVGASWDHRSIIAALQRNGQQAYPQYPLAVTVVSADGTTDLTVRPGSAAFVRFGVAAGNTGTLRVLVDGAGPTVDCTSPLSLGVGEVRVLSTSGAAAACLDGGADYAAIPVNTTLGMYNEANAEAVPSLRVGVAVSGVSAPVLSRSPVTPAALRLALGGFDGPTLQPDHAFEARLRRSEQALMLRGVGTSFGLPRLSRSVTSGPQDIHVVLVRTR